MGDEQEEFEKKLAAEQAAGFKDRMENSPPIGTGPDGKVVTYKSVDEIPGVQTADCPDVGTKRALEKAAGAF